MDTVPIGYDENGQPIETVTVTATRPPAIPEWTLILAVVTFLAFVQRYAK